jgi:hypothetical protein
MLTDREKVVRFQKDLFSEAGTTFSAMNCSNVAEEIQCENGDTTQVVCDRLITFYRLKLKKDESFLVVRSQHKFCGTIVSNDIPLKMALRELKDQKKHGYKVCCCVPPAAFCSFLTVRLC